MTEEKKQEKTQEAQKAEVKQEKKEEKKVELTESMKSIVGTLEKMTVLEMAEEIKRITGSKSEIIFKELPEDDPKVRQPDITLARTRLNWEPEVDVREALRMTIEWFRTTEGTHRGD